MKQIFLMCVMAVAGMSIVPADEKATAPEQKTGQESELVKSTFLITGLHCPPCAQTVEESLQGIKGVKSAKVDWKTKNARIEFDELTISAQQLSGKIATTAHMMGGDMKYSGWLALQVADLKESDDAEWDRLKDALGKVEGVKQVVAYKSKSGVGVRFATKGELTSLKLITAMTDSGFKLSNY